MSTWSEGQCTGTQHKARSGCSYRSEYNTVCWQSQRMSYVTWVSIDRGDSLYKFLVSCCSLDVQRPPGEELIHPDRIVTLERRVAAYERALEQLLRRPVGQREWYWGQQVTRLEDYLATYPGWLSLMEAERDGRTDLVTVDRVRQLQCQLDALYQSRYYDWLQSQVNVTHSHLDNVIYWHNTLDKWHD